MKLERVIIVILASIIVGLSVYVIFFDKGKNDYVDKYKDDKDKIDSLTAKISDLRKVQLKQDSLINTYESRIVYYKSEINKVDKKIATIRKEYEDRIKDAYNYTPSQLDSFFANRYIR
jgi:peptidoglycan hydrolase CwlO-like protein